MDPWQPLPLDHDDVKAILRGVFDANRRILRTRTRSSQSVDCWRIMRKRKRTDRSTEELLRIDPTLRLLADRIAYHEAKLAEERAARGEDASTERPFLSLSDDEQSEVAQRKLLERIAYHEAKLAEERAGRSESVGQ
jgi:hypothetical protein